MERRQQKLKQEELIRKKTGLPALMISYLESNPNKLQLSSRVEYAKDLKLLVQFIKASKKKNEATDEDLLKFSELDMNEFIAYLKKIRYQDIERKLGVSTQTFANKEVSVHRKIYTIQSFYDYLYDHKYINAKMNFNMLFIKDTKIHPEKQAFPLMSPSEIEIAFRKKERTKKHETQFMPLLDQSILIVLFFFYTGVTVSELVSLRSDDVLLNEKALSIRSRKEFTCRTLPIPDILIPSIRKYIANLRKEQVYFFESIQKKPFTQRAIRLRMKEMDLPLPLTPSICRNTFKHEAEKLTGSAQTAYWLLGNKSGRIVDTEAVFEKIRTLGSNLESRE